jgi:hypothetical protein
VACGGHGGKRIGAAGKNSDNGGRAGLEEQGMSSECIPDGHTRKITDEERKWAGKLGALLGKITGLPGPMSKAENERLYSRMRTRPTATPS